MSLYVKEALGISIVATSIPSCAFIAEVITIASSDTAGYAGYYIFTYDPFFLPSAYVLPLINPSMFMLGTLGVLACIPCLYWSVYWHSRGGNVSI